MSINENTAQEIRKRFNKRMSADPYLKKLMGGVENGSATFADVDAYACQVAECYNTAVHEVLGDVSIEEYRQAAQTAIPKGFHALYDRASDYTEQFINVQLQDAGIGMRAVRADYDAEKERDVTEKILERAQAAEEVSQVEDFANLQVESFAQKASMNTLQKNAEVQSRAGLEVTVTRIYDGVGVHRRKDECKWCLERCGEDMPYSVAVERGAFARHPGCHCEILYKTAKGLQRQTDWTHTKWEDVADEDTLRKRQDYETARENIPSYKEIKSRIRKGKLPNVDLSIYGVEFVEGERPYFPPDHNMAGKGCKTGRKIDDIDRLIREYRYFTTNGEKWSKQKAHYQVYDEYGQIRQIEIHWYQHPDVGKTEDKIKFRNGEMFIDMWNL